uniref:Uncharacterized protein n=1 Tax=Arundo donax TaxID=35708 RepID=A0A0A8Y3C3_ARUDO
MFQLATKLELSTYLSYKWSSFVAFCSLHVYINHNDAFSAQSITMYCSCRSLELK